MPLCPVVPCPEILPPTAYVPITTTTTAAAAAAAAAVAAATNNINNTPSNTTGIQASCPCGQCAPHMYTNHLTTTTPSTLIVNRFTEINYFDNPAIASLTPEKYAYEMVSFFSLVVYLKTVLRWFNILSITALR